MSRLDIQYVTNASPQSGVGHRAEEIAKRLNQRPEIGLTRWNIDGQAGALRREGEEMARMRRWPGVLGSKSVNWIRMGRALARQESQLRPMATLGEARIYDLTNQTLSFMAKKLRPAIVTVHDIIELLEPQDKRAAMLNRYLYSGIPAAEHIICVSEFTKKQVRQHYGVPDAKITVIYNGVGPEFHPIKNFKQSLAYKELCRQLKLPSGVRIVLSVGSDHPRKNVVAAVRAVANIGNPNIFIIKVGRAGLASGREALLDEIDRLKMRQAIRIIEDVGEDCLNELYNLADVFVYPSVFEGFGLPPLQAMAAGTPVIASRAAALPEVVGTAALTHDPTDVDELAALLSRVLSDAALAAKLRQSGLERARQFSWEDAASKTLAVYRDVGESHF